MRVKSFVTFKPFPKLYGTTFIVKNINVQNCKHNKSEITIKFGNEKNFNNKITSNINLNDNGRLIKNIHTNINIVFSLGVVTAKPNSNLVFLDLNLM